MKATTVRNLVLGCPETVITALLVVAAILVADAPGVLIPLG
jgi:hypothetical protein